ncbi:MerR family transcriptional regulator [Enterobacter cloacae]|uniref:MerR family transcriptional regulator n=1 Tax=Enterobacter cloacae TaxID=550 RepID=UPI000B8D4419|nr:MerR family transcriptional regulator [Enterobacter cloacae]ASQ19456.1 HTH-type transcriptional regulator MlrA [Enterobacter cloacae]MBN4790663.1 MerR family transcriptional regulator [Enterobacter cloacae]RTO58552.1 MerR family transcriptional regulator [Enterobacter cloacae]
MSYTIGVFSKKCGIAPTTLRAWQRRYGLLKPFRTEGGHRLYTDADLKQALIILDWIKKGVPVSQVKPLLSGSAPVTTDNWNALQEAILTRLNAGNAESLRHYIYECGREYPHREFVNEVIRPLRRRLPANVPSMRMMREILDGQIIAYTSFCMESDKKGAGENYYITGWHLADITEIWLEILIRTGQQMRFNVLPAPPSHILPEMFSDKNWVLVTSRQLTVVRQKQITEWKKKLRSLEIVTV